MARRAWSARRAARLAAILAAAASVGPGWTDRAAAHNGVDHLTPAEAAAHRGEERASGTGAAPASAPRLPVTPDALFPTGIGGAYQLTDQHGTPRDQTDPEGRPQLVFFGYANCEAICSVALPAIAETTKLLEADGVLATPVLITVDPEHDTPEAMRAALPRLHRRFVGLTGPRPALRQAEAAFHVESRVVAHMPEGAPIYAHGSYIYLMDGDGAFLTLMPPILGPARMAEIVAGYVAPR
ncbi:MAG: SCO family protein [Pseudomonadota bacterium]